MENKKHWKGIEELNEDPGFVEERDKEFRDELPIEEILESSFIQQSHSRRDFLRFLGFSVTAATVAASCRIPVKKAIPYVIKPEEILVVLDDFALPFGRVRLRLDGGPGAAHR